MGVQVALGPLLLAVFNFGKMDFLHFYLAVVHDKSPSRILSVPTQTIETEILFFAIPVRTTGNMFSGSACVL